MKRFLAMGWLALVSVLLFNLSAVANGPSKLSEAEKIDRLIAYVRNLDGAVFIRNGSEYPAAKAADHLELKRENAGSRIKTARSFIDLLATKSSMSGKPYYIRFSNGKTYTSAAVLLNELERLEGKK